MIDATILPFFTGIFPIICAITLLVLRAGASRVFFDIVGTFQAERLIKDADAARTVFEALYLDTFMGIQESGQEIGEMFTDILDEIRPITEEIEEARIQLEKFLDVPTDEMNEVAESITEIGLALGFAADEAMLAGAKMAQLSGVLGPSTMDVGTEIGMMFGLISGMETDAAMQRLINLQQQTKFMTENIEEGMDAEAQANVIRRDSMRVLNQLNTVENRSVATMEQITFVMNQFASQAKLTNESIASMAALSATLIEAGEEQGKGGRALRMMYARLGADINGSRKAVEDLGIAVADSEGNMRPLSRVLEDLSVEYQKMNGEQQTALAQQVAGNRHYTRLIKLLENVDRVKELEFEATIAMFPAMDEIDRRRDTELFKLQQAEKEYKNVSGAIGDNLLPALTAATKQQTVFLDQIEILTSSKGIGSLISLMIRFTQLTKNFAGPAMMMIVNLQNMNIALQTQQTISRALNGEKIAHMEGTEKGMSLLLSEIALQKEKNRLMQEEALAAQKARRRELTAGKGLGTRNVNTARTMAKRLRGEMAGLKKDIKDVNKEQAKLIYGIEAEERAISRLEMKLIALGSQKTKVANAERKRLVESIDGHETNINQLQEEISGTYNKIDAINEEYNVKSAREEMFQAKVDEALDRRLRKEAILNEIESIGVKHQAKQFQVMTMGIASLGTAFMMLPDSMIPFLDKQEEMRIGMALNTVAMGAQIGKTVLQAGSTLFAAKTSVVFQKEMLEEAAAIGLTTKEMLAKASAAGVVGAAELFAAEATEKHAEANITLASALGLSSTAMKKLGIVGAVIGGALLISKVYDHFSQKAKKAADEMDRFNSVSLDTGRVLEIMRDGTINVESEIERLTKELKALDGTQDKMSQARITAIESEIAALVQVRRITKFQSGDMQEGMEASKKYFNTLDLLDKKAKAGYDPAGLSVHGGENSIAEYTERLASDFGDAFNFMSFGIIEGDWGKNLGGPIQNAKDELELFKETYVDLAAFIDLHKITTFEELETTAESFGTSIEELMGQESLAVNNLGKEYSMLNDELTGFANSREEMFYGFDRNNLTGDLVRQVTQQGVDTLVTNTEVIMTNNFNNILTIPEMADQIILEIESRGISNGYTVG